MKSKDASTVTAPDEAPPAGPVVRGKLLCRARRETKNREGKTRYLISLSILAAQGLFVVQRWSDEALPKGLPVVGEQVEIPIRIGAYLQAGVPKVRLAWDTGEVDNTF